MTMRQNAIKDFHLIDIEKDNDGYRAIFRRGNGYPDIILTEEARPTRAEARKAGQKNYIELYKALVIGGTFNLK